jgi:ArsR family transcriptional regulator, virulence genes transcriptional regulator
MQSSIHSIVINNYDEKTTELNTLQNKKALYILRAINHLLRLEIIKLINEKKQITVTEIYTHLKISQAVASQHLAILRKAGFVCTKKESKFVYYMLSYHFINHFSKTIDAFFNND